MVLSWWAGSSIGRAAAEWICEAALWSAQKLSGTGQAVGSAEHDLSDNLADLRFCLLTS